MRVARARLARLAHVALACCKKNRAGAFARQQNVGRSGRSPEWQQKFVEADGRGFPSLEMDQGYWRKAGGLGACGSSGSARLAEKFGILMLTLDGKCSRQGDRHFRQGAAKPP
jgi:hypothetical protein